MRLLGLDVGTKTIGVAVSDDGGVVATPYKTLQRFGGKRDLDGVRQLMEETGAAALVVGLPRELSGREGDAARRSRILGRQLAEGLACEVTYWDERFTTTEAERMLISADVSRRKRKKVIDQIAASLILQGYLDSKGYNKGDEQ